jgi:hypothetical protein
MADHLIVTRVTINSTTAQQVVQFRYGRKELHIERLLGGPNTGYYGPTSSVTVASGKASEPGPIMDLSGAVWGICDSGTIDIQAWEIF